MGTHAEAETPRLTADTVLFAKDNNRENLHVLLIRRAWDPFAGCWALPGGHVDSAEETFDAACRELAEETGVRIATALKPAGVYAAPGRDPRGRYVTFAYTAYVPFLLEAIAADDAAEARWILVRDVLHGTVSVAFDHRQIIAEALNVITSELRNETTAQAYALDCERNARAAADHADRIDLLAKEARKEGATDFAGRETARAIQLRMDAAAWQAKADNARSAL